MTKGLAINEIHEGKKYSKLRNPSSVQFFNNRLPNDRGAHPTQKPVALFEYLIRTYTDEGETVLDNCIGSGTTAVAAINANRNFIGIEQDHGYVATARQRINDMVDTERR